MNILTGYRESIRQNEKMAKTLAPPSRVAPHTPITVTAKHEAPLDTVNPLFSGASQTIDLERFRGRRAAHPRRV